jgi:hypothetical protein
MLKFEINSYPQEIISFYKENKIFYQKEINNFLDCLNDEEIAYFKINFNFNKNIFLEECKQIDDLFVSHRKNDSNNGYQHRGWSAITLHGIDKNKTEHYTQYGFKSQDEANYQWTDVCDNIPNIYNFLNSLPYRKFDRVRIMRLESHGYIMPHNDNNKRTFGPLNIAINNPDKCFFIFEKYGIVPFEPGNGFILDVSKTHAVINMSKETRYHIIVHGEYGGNSFNAT